MCIHQREIVNKYTGRSLIVKCGKCPSCLQEKALNRVNRINQTISPDCVPVFFTLTYKNGSVPYILRDELYNCRYSTSMRRFIVDVPIYRDSSVRWVNGKGYVQKRREDNKRVILSTVTLSYSPIYSLDKFKPDYSSLYGLKGLKNADNNKIGVCFYKDIQDFIKRLRINLKRHYNYEKLFRFYCCSEYGPTTCRPHFHGLLFINPADYPMFKRAIAASWSFDDYRTTFRHTQLARKASSYVASYVNSDSAIPKVFTENAVFKPRHSYSHGFGLAYREFSFKEVTRKILTRSPYYTSTRVRNNTLSVVDMLLPRYVISRYYPKFKGYYRLTYDEIKSILHRPSEIRKYATRLELTEEDVHKISVLLSNKRNMACLCGIDMADYEQAGATAWTVRSSCALRDMYKVKDVDDYFIMYNNIDDYLRGNISNETLDTLLDFKLSVTSDGSKWLYTDCNKFPNNIVHTDKFTKLYYSYDKSKKIRNKIYSQTKNF